MSRVLFLILLVYVATPLHAQTFNDYVAQANALYNAGKYEASGQAFDNAFAMKEASGGDYYNAACSWSLAGNTDKAFHMLESALAHGHHNVALLLGDTDLDNLRKGPRWEGVVAKYREAEEAYLNTVNRELYDLYQADQADRHGDIDWSVVTPRDIARRTRVQEMIDEDLLKAPDDFVHAAFIFQHGSDSTSYRMAHELAMAAVALDSTDMNARWIAAAAKDRYLHSRGLPQIYGTQLHTVNGVWTLSPFDTTAVTDEERARWGVPPLARQRAWEKKVQSKSDKK